MQTQLQSVLPFLRSGLGPPSQTFATTRLLLGETTPVALECHAMHQHAMHEYTEYDSTSRALDLRRVAGKAPVVSIAHPQQTAIDALASVVMSGLLVVQTGI